MYGTINPKSQGVENGDNILIICYSAAEVRWTFNGGPLPANANEGNNYIRMADASDRHIGKYECHGTLLNGNTFLESATIYVGGKYYIVVLLA